MSKKNKPDSRGYVYSTDPGFSFKEENKNFETILPAKQKLRVWVDTKRRGGKAATLITDFIGKTEDLDELGKNLKNYCGTGGSVKDGEIMIQGDQRQKVLQWLIKTGYINSKLAG